jgi:NifB/MoaA-like Fe-S oxidoreductase
MSRDKARELLRQVEAWTTRSRRERDDTWVFGSDELYLLAGEELPGPDHYGEFAQIENGIGAITSLRMRVEEGLVELPRLEGMRIGVVTGTAMSDLMPELIEKIENATGADLVLIPMENSLFGPTITTAGLLIGADIRRALEGRVDLDAALIPAETLNDDRIFLDDVEFDALAASLPIPVYPSYDFVDVLASEELAVAA